MTRRLRVALFGTLTACSLEAQMISPPQTVWGDIQQEPEGLVVGGVELLAGLLIALAAVLCLSAFLAYRQRMISEYGLPLIQLRRQLALCTFVASPMLGLATIVLAGSRLLFGVEVALLGVTLSLITVIIGTASLMTVRF